MNNDPLCVSLVHQYLESTKSVLADQFKTKYQPKRTRVMLTEVVTKWKEEQLARSIVYQHLRKVAPALALEFAESFRCIRKGFNGECTYKIFRFFVPK